MSSLQDVVRIHRRYSRSINLDRDLGSPKALEGYVPTDKGLDALRRISYAARTPGSVRAWSISGAYGTGKSAFALFLASAFGPRTSSCRSVVDQLLMEHLGAAKALRKARTALPAAGLLSAVTVAQREPLAHAVVRALATGIAAHWPADAFPADVHRAQELAAVARSGGRVAAGDALAALRQVAMAAGGMLLVIDELGKVLEYASIQPQEEDLFLLQQIAELPAGPGDPLILTMLLLHRAFTDYTMPMQATERAEWAKVQGRFEDIPYAEGPGHVIRLVCRAIEHQDVGGIAGVLDAWAGAWHQELVGLRTESLALGQSEIRAMYPLHPLTALALPVLCSKYAQNDRSLFSFLTSWEAHGFHWFLAETPWRETPLVTLKPHQLYDYFVETARMAAASRPEFQRWTEVQSRVSECADLPDPLVAVVKTVGLFNLVAMSGALRASRVLVVRALADTPADVATWNMHIDEALERRLVTWRKQADELRIWEGSDFDVEQALVTFRAGATEPLPLLLERLAPLSPAVARRHSYESGTLRYYERRYLNDSAALGTLMPKDTTSDGILVHWLGDLAALGDLPSQTAAGHPILVLAVANLVRLKLAAQEVVALEQLEAGVPQLQTDGIARREVQLRLAIARTTLEVEISRACGAAAEAIVVRDDAGSREVPSGQQLNALLSAHCDRAYHAGPRLWTELLNRRELTSQGAKARRELIEAMLTRAGEPDLGLSGYGPEVSMARSALVATDLYHEGPDGVWRFQRPNNYLNKAYDAIHRFVSSAVDRPRTVDSLFTELARPPYGVKAGPLPVLLAAYTIAHGDAVGFYQDGSFVPVPGAEHFELLVKHPGRFALKSFQLEGPRGRLRDQLSAALAPTGAGPASLVGIVRQLMGLARRWPEFTRRTRAYLDPIPLAIRNALLAAREPDVLLFEVLPATVGHDPITGGETDGADVTAIAQAIVAGLREVESAYSRLLARATKSLGQAFALPADTPFMRAAFQLQAAPVLALLESTVSSPRHADALLRRFLIAASDPSGDDYAWLEATLMVAMDRPVGTWIDGDAAGLEHRLAELAGRFRNLEAYARDPRSAVPGQDLRLLSFAPLGGETVTRVVQIDEAQREKLDRLVARTLAEGALAGDQALQAAFIAKLFEAVFQMIPAAVSTEVSPS